VQRSRARRGGAGSAGADVSAAAESRSRVTAPRRWLKPPARTTESLAANAGATACHRAGKASTATARAPIIIHRETERRSRVQPRPAEPPLRGAMARLPVVLAGGFTLRCGGVGHTVATAHSQHRPRYRRGTSGALLQPRIPQHRPRHRRGGAGRASDPYRRRSVREPRLMRGRSSSRDPSAPTRSPAPRTPARRRAPRLRAGGGSPPSARG